MGKASKLVEDLKNVPEIVAGLGLAVAEAQKAFNLDYLENVERLLGLIKSTLDPEKASGELTPKEKTALEGAQSELKDLLLQLAPSRYQFSETTLAVRLDLAQTLDVGVSAGFGAAVGAVSLNAAATVAFGYDYRAAAEVRTVIHAIPPSEATFKKVIGRAKELSAQSLVLPPGAQVDKDLVEKAHALTTKMTDVTLKKPA